MVDNVVNKTFFSCRRKAWRITANAGDSAPMAGPHGNATYCYKYIFKIMPHLSGAVVGVPQCANGSLSIGFSIEPYLAVWRPLSGKI
jgi:hypothetical protein